MTEPHSTMRTSERTAVLVLVLLGLAGLIVGFASGRLLIAAICGALAGISLSVLALRVLLRTH